jgi:fructose-1,6-bisphosphatase III
MDALDTLVRRAYRQPAATSAQSDADWFWYLWAGPRSPLFGKDKIATFEGYFVADKAAREEHKNAYFEMIHDAEFVKKIGRDFGMGDDVLIVNGHVPVKIEKRRKPRQARRQRRHHRRRVLRGLRRPRLHADSGSLAHRPGRARPF